MVRFIYRKTGKSLLGLKAGSVKINSVDRVIKAIRSCAFFAQVFSPRAVASAEQVFFAHAQMRNAFEQGTNLLSEPHMEFLLRLTGKKQVGKALEGAEVKEGAGTVLLAVEGKTQNEIKKNFAVLERELGFAPLSAEKTKKFISKNAKKNAGSIKRFYGVSEAELAALKGKENPLADAVIERIALLGLE
ncbi:MAG: KEOPS complex subunit Cgi121 [Candidatus Diapherotrites archaeon]